MKPSRKILGIRLRNFDSGISKEMNWVGAILDYLDEQAESQETKVSGEKGCPCGNEDRYHMEKRIFEGGFNAKLQDEPKECCEKCRQYLNKNMNRYECNRYFTCPCHQKETEPKEEIERDMDLDRCKNKECIGYKKGYTDGAMVEKEQNALRNSAAIILPRPKGKSIFEALEDFRMKTPKAWFATDEKFLELWSQFIKSQE